MKSIAAVSRVKASVDGHGVVLHAGVGILRELAELTGLSAHVTAALADTYRGAWMSSAGRVDDHDVAAGRCAGRCRLSARYPRCPRQGQGPRVGRRCRPGTGEWLHLYIDWAPGWCGSGR